MEPHQRLKPNSDTHFKIITFFDLYIGLILFFDIHSLLESKIKKKPTQTQKTSKKQKNNNKPSKSKTKQKTPLKQGDILLKHHSQIIGVYGSWKFDTSEEI